MREGAFGMFDALGFKGVWERAEQAQPPWDVLGKLEGLMPHADEVQGAADDAIRTLKERGQLADATTCRIFLSDTIAFGCWAQPAPGQDPRQASMMALVVVCNFIGNLMARAAQSPEPRFAYRGCVTYGRFDMRSSFIVGPAVDEAAIEADRAEAAFVWLAPSALQVTSYEDPWLLRSWAVPLKGRRNESATERRTLVVSPYVGVQPESYAGLHASIMSTFEGAKTDVTAKKNNTKAFLDAELARLQADAGTSPEQAPV